MRQRALTAPGEAVHDFVQNIEEHLVLAIKKRPREDKAMGSLLDWGDEDEVKDSKHISCCVVCILYGNLP